MPLPDAQLESLDREVVRVAPTAREGRWVAWGVAPGRVNLVVRARGVTRMVAVEVAD